MFTILPSENFKEYKLRLFRNKEAYGLSNTDIAELLNNISGENKNESTYRKWFAPYEEGYNDAMCAYESELEDSRMTALTTKRAELEIIKKQIQTEKIEINKWLREQARTELLHEKLIDAIKSNLQDNSTPKPIRNSSLDSEKDVVLFLSDQHFGTEFTIRGVNGEVLNEYSPEVFYSRMDTIFNETIEYLNTHDADHLYIMSLGDTLDGLLRHSQLAKLRWGVVDSAIKFGKYMLGWLIELSEYCKITFAHTFGNHTELRLLDGKKGEHTRENLDKIILEIIQIGVEATHNRNITIINNETPFIYTTLSTGYSIFGCHGESANLENALRNYQQMYNIDIDYIAAGHLHTSNYNMFGSRSGAIRVGSIIGVDDFAIKIEKRSDASAAICVFKKDKGLVDIHNIILN